MEAVLVVKQVSRQIIFFLLSLIILGFVAPSIASLRGNVSKVLLFSFAIAYLSSVGAAFFGVFVSYQTIPLLHIEAAPEVTCALPSLRFLLEIPPVMSVMTALVLSIFVGLGVIWTNSTLIGDVLMQFQKIVLLLVKRILLPLLPFFMAANFCALSYQGSLSKLSVFLPVVLIVIVCHYLWLLFLYVLAGLYAGKNSWQVLRYYAPAYFTAIGTMSSAATLGVALECIQKSPILDKKISDFGVRGEIAFVPNCSIFSPYFSIELYQQIGQQSIWAVDRMRYRLGLQIQISKKLVLDLFYYFQYESKGKKNIIGVDFSISL